MKISFKALLAVTLTLALVLSTVMVPGAVVYAVDGSAISPRLLFADNCNTENGAISSNWAVGNGSATADGEKYTISKGSIYLPYNQGMQDYIVQADISIPNTTYGEGIFASKGSAAICVRHDPSTDTGYEYGVIVGRDTVDSANVRLYGRNSSSALNQSSPIADALYEGDTAQALSTNVYTCKVQVSGRETMS